VQDTSTEEKVPDKKTKLKLRQARAETQRAASKAFLALDEERQDELEKWLAEGLDLDDTFASWLKMLRGHLRSHIKGLLLSGFTSQEILGCALETGREDWNVLGNCELVSVVEELPEAVKDYEATKGDRKIVAELSKRTKAAGK
jgi:hypothetical protein